MRLIDADALLERKENLPTIGGNGWCHRDYVDTIWIDRAPTIDPTVHAKTDIKQNDSPGSGEKGKSHERLHTNGQIRRSNL